MAFYAYPVIVNAARTPRSALNSIDGIMKHAVDRGYRSLLFHMMLEVELLIAIA